MGATADVSLTGRAYQVNVSAAIAVFPARRVADAVGGRREALADHLQVAALGEPRRHARTFQRGPRHGRCGRERVQFV